MPADYIFSLNQCSSGSAIILFGTERVVESQLQIKTSSSVIFCILTTYLRGENNLYQIGSQKSHWFKTTGLKLSSIMDLNLEF